MIEFIETVRSPWKHFRGLLNGWGHHHVLQFDHNIITTDYEVALELFYALKGVVFWPEYSHLPGARDACLDCSLGTGEHMGQITPHFKVYKNSKATS